MSSSDLIRWSGLAAMVGGALLAVGAFFDLMYFSPEPMSEVVPTGSFLFQQVLYLLGATLLLIGLVGLYARQSQAAGALGLVGFLIAFAGTVLAAGLFWAGMFIAPALATEAPDFVDAGPPPGFVLTFIGFGVGWLVFGIATLRAGVYPRWGLPALGGHTRHCRCSDRHPPAALYHHRAVGGCGVAGLPSLHGQRAWRGANAPTRELKLPRIPLPGR